MKTFINPQNYAVAQSVNTPITISYYVSLGMQKLYKKNQVIILLCVIKYDSERKPGRVIKIKR